MSMSRTRCNTASVPTNTLASGATLSVLPVPERGASEFGLMKIDGGGRITAFSEKPKGQALQAMRVDTQSLGLPPAKATECPFIASMGIYVFERQVLLDLLRHRGWKLQLSATE